MYLSEAYTLKPQVMLNQHDHASVQLSCVDVQIPAEALLTSMARHRVAVSALQVL